MYSKLHKLCIIKFSPSVRKPARYPAWKFRRGFSVATRPRRRCVANGSQLLCCLTRTTCPKQTRSTAQCSVRLSVMRQQMYRTTKLRLAEICSGEEYDAGRHCRSSSLKKKTA